MPLRKPTRRLFGAFFVLTFAGFLWPLNLLGNRVEPMILGLPFLLFWFVALILAQFAALVALYLLQGGD